MKIKFCSIVLFITILSTTYAQQSIDTSIRVFLKQGITATERENKINNLYLLGKIWGFLKYYHPAIASGKYNWDRELLQFLPVYCNVKNIIERNDSLGAWINRFGKVEACNNCNDSLLKNVKLKPDFSWMDRNGFSTKLIYQLKNIKNNRLQKDQYYIKYMAEDDVYLVLPQHEEAYGKLVFPSDGYSILSVFRFWNVIEYWYPYKYGLPLSWDAVLKKIIPQVLAHKNTTDYTLSIQELATSIYDSHSVISYGKTEEIKGKYFMPFTVKFLEEKLVITSILNDSLAKLANIKVFDIIDRIDNEPVEVIVKKMAKYCPASNRWALLRTLSYWITRSPNERSSLSIKREGSGLDISVINYIPKNLFRTNMNPPYFSFQKDSAFCMLKDSIGYINVGRFNRNDSVALNKFVANTKSLIIDNRQNQDEQKGTGGGDIISNLIQGPDKIFVKFSTAQPSYPGVFSFTKPTNLYSITRLDYYKGRVAILVNEQTQSVGEFLTMAFQKAAKPKVIGSTTAGADGNVGYITLPGGILVQYTGLGVYYPNGKETQRVGIKPSIEVKQTIAGYKNNIDEQLQKAIDYLQEKK